LFEQINFELLLHARGRWPPSLAGVIALGGRPSRRFQKLKASSAAATISPDDPLAPQL